MYTYLNYFKSTIVSLPLLKKKPLPLFRIKITKIVVKKKPVQPFSLFPEKPTHHHKKLPIETGKKTTLKKNLIIPLLLHRTASYV